MLTDLDEYIESHSDAEPQHLYKLRRDTALYHLRPRMCSGHLQGRILRMIVRMTGAHDILELGTYTGYSALCLAEVLPPDGHLDTIERDDEIEDFILAHFEGRPEAERISLHIGKAEEVLPTLKDRRYDLVFIDADKRDYIEYYRKVFPLVKPGGFILADNTLWDGHVTDAAYDHDAQTLGIRRFNDYVASDKRVEKVILPLRDGLTLIYKKTDDDV